MELKQVANFFNGRYLISNRKKDKPELLNGKLLASCSVDWLGFSKQVVEYYDTPDLFFADRGISIYTILKGVTKELIVSYDSGHVRRIEFLKNIPNFFKLTLNNKKDNINNYFEQINGAIYQLFPEGLHVNVIEILNTVSVQLTINKKCESYMVVNNNGLKTTFSFTISTYINKKKKQKFTQDHLEVQAEAQIDKSLFDNFLRYIILDCPKLIKTTSNEFEFARKNFDQ